MIGLSHYLTVAAILFTIGVLGIFLNRRNIILMLMAIELILLAVNINLVAFSAYLGDLTGQVFAMFVLTHRSRGDVRGQKVWKQVDRRPDEAIKLERPKVGEGVKL